MPNQIASLDRVFQALGNPSRRSVIERLSSGAAPVSELARPLRMSLPSVLQHLQVLEASGLVRSEKTGRVRRYWLEPGSMASAEQWMLDRRTAWEMRLDRLGELLVGDEPRPSERVE